MGNCNVAEVVEDPNKVSLTNIRKICPIGRGGFGKVWLVKMKGIQSFKQNSSLEDLAKFAPDYDFALKEMSKAKIVQKKSVDSIRNERKFLEQLHHPLLVNMQFAFETRENLFLIMDFLSGGDLRYNICNKKSYSEAQTKFIIACIVLVLEYLRTNHIVHRDLKPENLVFDSFGFTHLTDFGIAYDASGGREIIDSSGTPGYMAPEIFTHEPQSYAVDYFALGVITHELMLRRRPYNAVERKPYKEEVLTKEIHLTTRSLPTRRGWKDESVIDFINGLLARKAEDRLGYGDIREIIQHPWLSDVDWEGIYSKRIKPPITIHNTENYDSEYANRPDDPEDEDTVDHYLQIANNKKYFRDYYYNRFENKASSNKKLKRSKSQKDFPATTGLSKNFTEKMTEFVPRKRRGTTRKSTYANPIYRNLLLLNKQKQEENKKKEKEEGEEEENDRKSKVKERIEEGDEDNDRKNTNREDEYANLRPKEDENKRKKKVRRRSVIERPVNHEKILDELQN